MSEPLTAGKGIPYTDADIAQLRRVAEEQNSQTVQAAIDRRWLATLDAARDRPGLDVPCHCGKPWADHDVHYPDAAQQREGAAHPTKEEHQQWHREHPGNSCAEFPEAQQREGAARLDAQEDRQHAEEQEWVAQQREGAGS